MAEGKRSVGLVGAVAIGIGGMVGGGIFAVLGEAVAVSHGATGLAFVEGGVIALLTALAYARLAVTYQNRGGTVFFIDTAFGNNLASGSLNVLLWLSYLVTIALYATAFASYAQPFFGGSTAPWLRHVLISVAILLPTGINLVSASFVSRSETAVVALKLVLLLVIIATSASFIDPERVAPAHWGSAGAVFAAGMIIFVAYEGFELIANSAEDIKDPERNLPRAFVTSVLLVIVLYVVIGVITVCTVPESKLVEAKDYALAVAAQPALGHTGFVIVSVAALLATFSAINATIYGNGRLGYVLAKDGELPEAFDRQVWDEPVTGVLATAGISLLIANAIPLEEIAIIGSASFLLVFTLVNASAWKLASHIGGRRAVYAAGGLLCAVALVVLLVRTWSDNARAVLVFAGFLALSVLFEVIYGMGRRGHFLGRKYKDG